PDGQNDAHDPEWASFYPTRASCRRSLSALSLRCLSHYLSTRVAAVAARMGAQRAISERTNRSNEAGLRSALACIEPPSLASVSPTTGSSSALSRASASLAITSGATPLGANSPDQTLIS